MRRNIRRAALVAGVAAIAVLVPTGVALADNGGPGPGPNGDSVATCTNDQQRLRDGTGPRHDEQSAEAQPYGHRSGPQDGTGPRTDRPLDGTGHMWGGNGS